MTQVTDSPLPADDPDFLTDAHGESIDSEREDFADDQPLNYEDWTIEYSPVSRARRPIRLLLEIFHDLWVGRELSWRLFVRNIVGSVRQTLLSYVWIVLPTMAMIAGWSFLHQQTLLGGFDGHSYLAFIAVGSIFWQAFFDSILAPINTIRANQRLVTKLNFPRESLILVGLGEVLFHLSVRLVILGVVLVLTGSPIGLASLTSLFWLAGLVTIGTAIGLFLGPIEVLYQDVGKSLTVLSPFWMILTPVVYMPPASPTFAFWQVLNPPSAMLTTARDMMVSGEMAIATGAWGWWLFSIPLLILGMAWYRLAFPIVIERMNS
jgi:lipopolysaccharide transport system permease protein